MKTFVGTGQPRATTHVAADDTYEGFDALSETNNGDYLIINTPPNLTESFGIKINMSRTTSGNDNQFLVTNVTKGSLADKGKVKVGMHIVEVNDNVVTENFSTVKDLANFIRSNLNQVSNLNSNVLTQLQKL